MKNLHLTKGISYQSIKTPTIYMMVVKIYVFPSILTSYDIQISILLYQMYYLYAKESPKHLNSIHSESTAS